jgi:hypothetical protein
MSSYNSEIISEVIGDYPILDQFDNSYIAMLSGTYLDDFVTGSLVSTFSVNGKKQISLGQRGRVFSHVNAQGYPTHRFSQSKTLQPWSEVAKIPSTVTMNDNLERWWDSMMPSITETLTVDGTNIFLPAENVTTRTYFYTNINHVASGTRGWVFFNWTDTGPSPTYTNNNWQSAFPFEPKYVKIARQQSQNNALFAKTILSLASSPYPETPLNDPKKVSGLMPVFTKWSGWWFTSTSEDPNPNKAINWYIMGDIRNQSLTGSADIDEINKFYYGFGDNRTKSYTDYHALQGNNNFPSFRKTNRGYSFVVDFGSFLMRVSINYVFGPIIRGWKYGVQNGNQLFNKAIFRKDKYGQLRDMLEQRPAGKFFITDDNFKDGENTQVGPTQAVVNVKFVDSNGRRTKPENTWSQNLSFEATSSYPYFEGEERNRNPINVNTLNSNTINFNVSRTTRRITI